MREYEVTAILKPDLEDEARTQLIERLAGWLTHGSDEDDKPKLDHWGKMRLAYPIEKFRDGYYIYFEALLDPSRISEMERDITYLDDVLRHLVVRKEA
jgi:small subunit ribosomal protein S6